MSRFVPRLRMLEKDLMKKTCCRWIWVLIGSVLLGQGETLRSRAVEGMGEADPPYLSPAALVCSADGGTIYVACANAQRVLKVDAVSHAVVGSIPVDANPVGLVLSKSESRLYVTCATATSTVCVVDTATGHVVQKIPGGHTTVSPVLSPDNSVLFVCHRFDNEVVAIDLRTHDQRWRAKVPREPIAAARTPDGKRLVIANHIHSGRADGGVIAAVVSVLDSEDGRIIKNIRLPRGSGLAQALRFHRMGGSRPSRIWWRAITYPPPLWISGASTATR